MYLDRDRERNLRSLAVARGVKDLRTLDAGRDNTGRPSDAVPYAVWAGLLAMSTLDLRPFRVPREDRWNSGSGIPLAILADVQIYTTNADPLVEGKGHSPDCQHAGRGGISRHDDLLTLAQLLDKDDMDWCGKCGGYTVRWLTPAQLAHYRAAHRLHAVATTLRGDRPSAHDPLDTASLVSELDELAAWRTGGLEDDSPVAVADAWRWKQIVDDLSAKVRVESCPDDRELTDLALTKHRPLRPSRTEKHVLTAVSGRVSGGCRTDLRQTWTQLRRPLDCRRLRSVSRTPPYGTRRGFAAADCRGLQHGPTEDLLTPTGACGATSRRTCPTLTFSSAVWATIPTAWYGLPPGRIPGLEPFIAHVIGGLSLSLEDRMSAGTEEEGAVALGLLGAYMDRAESFLTASSAPF
ncbi:hypothetical protein ACWGCP_03435 [Streptomyces niveus]